MSRPLTDLSPKWIPGPNGRRGMGILFECPHCVDAKLRVRQQIPVFFAVPLDGGSPDEGHAPDRLWERDGDTFETLTLRPSVDASAYGHWHGFVRSGRVE